MTTHQELVSKTWAAVRTANAAELTRLSADISITEAFRSMKPHALSNPFDLVHAAVETNDDSTAILDILFSKFEATINAQDTTKFFRHFSVEYLTKDSKFKTAKFLHIIEKYIDKAKSFDSASDSDSLLATHILRFLIDNKSYDLLVQCLENATLKAAVAFIPENKSLLQQAARLSDADNGCHPLGRTCKFEKAIAALEGLDYDFPAPGHAQYGDIQVRATLLTLEHAIFDQGLLKRDPQEHCNKAQDALRTVQCSSHKAVCVEEIGKMLTRLLPQIDDSECKLNPITTVVNPCLTIVPSTITAILNTTDHTINVRVANPIDTDTCTELSSAPTCTYIDNEICLGSVLNIAGMLALTSYSLHH